MFAKFDSRDGIILAGVASLLYGLWLIYSPAMFIGFGVLCLGFWWIGRR
jgi:hypothetical protein